MQLPPEVGFNTAKRLLNEKYGDPHKMAQQNQIKKQPQIKAGDFGAKKNFRNS